MSFKSSVLGDIGTVFLNSAEFADTLTIEYNGEEYEDINVSLQDEINRGRSRASNTARDMGGGNYINDHMQGLSTDRLTLYVRASDVDNVRFEKNTRLIIVDSSEFDNVYEVESCNEDMGLYTVKLLRITE